MITSEYLEQIVDFNQPILVVGPGLDHLVEGEIYPLAPMDRALIWLAEKIGNRDGLIDVLDLHPNDPTGGAHDWRYVQAYCSALRKMAPIADINFLIGDVAKISFTRKYGLIWDHGTLAYWSMHSPKSYWSMQPPSDLPAEKTIDNQNKRIRHILKKYYSTLRKNGRAVISFAKNDARRLAPRMESFWPVKPKTTLLDNDLYRTILTKEQISLGGQHSDYFLDQELLIQKYCYQVMIEMEKK